MIVELHGLEVFGRHGVLEEEKLDGQTFLYDVELEVDEPAADRIEDAVDYRRRGGLRPRGLRLPVVRPDRVAGRGRGRRADVAARRPRVRVRVRKPRPAGIAAAWSAATADRSR